MLLEFPKVDRGIAALTFSPCGEKLATVSMDNSHTMYIWNVGRGAKKVQRQGEDGGDALVWGKTAVGAPPTVAPCFLRPSPRGGGCPLAFPGRTAFLPPPSPARPFVCFVCGADVAAPASIESLRPTASCGAPSMTLSS